MSAVDAPKPADLPQAGHVEPAPAPVLESGNASAPVDAPAATEEVAKTEDDIVGPPTELKEDKAEDKVVEPIYSGALGYKAPGLKNAFRFAKKHFWFGEEPVDSANLREYLRGEKPEVAHPVVAWASQTGKGLLFFVKHADQKEHPAGVLNLAYATDLVKDGAIAFSVKISGHKHTFEAQTAAERDGWFIAVEKAITEAKASKDTIESSDGYKEQKEKISKPTALAGATSAPKKSLDATPKLAEGEAAAATSSETPAVVPARTGSSSSSSSDEEKKAKKTKSKSRSASRKRASIFGFGKKEKALKDEGAVKTEPEVKAEEPAVVPNAEAGETSAAGPVTTNAPVITQDIPHAGQELKDEATPAAATSTETDATAAASTQEKPAVKKRGSIFGSFVEKLKSPTTEKKEHDFAPQPPAKDAETIPESSKPLDEAVVGAPATPVVAEPASESAAHKTEEKPISTPSKEKEHFSFGKLFGSKERSKSPAAGEKASEPKVDAAAPQIQDPAPAADESAAPLQAVEPIAPTTETKVEEETPKKEKRTSFFGNLSRSLSKATSGKKDSKPAEKKEPAAAIPEAEENNAEVPVVAQPEEASAPAPAEKTIGDVPAEAVTVGEAPKGAQTVSTTA